MNPESPVIAELRPLLDALCEESITAPQLARLEELVLNHPEAEAFYVQFMSFHADLIGHFAGLPELPLADDAPNPEPKPKVQENTMDGSFSRWGVAAAVLLVLGALSAAASNQYFGWVTKSREVAETQAALEAARSEEARLQAERDAARQAAFKDIAPAEAAEQELTTQYQAALDAAKKAIEAKDFLVRLTGPARVHPGAPNKWQIETLRHGAVARPHQMEVIVQDERNTELLRETHNKPVGVATLELPTSFWAKVKPGTDLFLQVVAYTDDNRKSVIAERIPLARPVFVTHLATDKPLYKPGETVRFRSLTLDRSTLLPPEHDLHLRFRLRDPADTAVPLDEGNGRVLHELQPIQGPDKRPIRGIGVGEYTLPSDAPGGEYKLDLFEVIDGKDVLLETRKFLVNRYVPDIFEKKLEFDGKSYGAGDWVQARIEVSRTAGGPMKDARANVVATVDGREFHKQTGEKFTIVTDGGVAKAVLNVRFQVPADVYQKSGTPNATLSVNIQDGSDAEPIVRPIPLVTKNLTIEFFPEGGDLIEGIPGRVYMQVRTPTGKPADLKGYITDGTTKVADVVTLTDAENPGVNRGHGVFTLTPKPGAKYFLKLNTPTGITEPTPDGFPLPKAKADGVALTALDAVTDRGAAIRVRIHSATGPKTLHVGAYARGRLISHQKLEVEANKPVDVALQGDEAAGGVTRVTVFEEPKSEAAGRAALIPRAERLVYRKPGEQLILKVNPDKARYTPGGKVRLELSAVNEKAKATPAILLVAVVNQSVITMADNKTDRLMPTHFLLSGDVKHPAELEHADFLLTDHPKAAIALDLLLGTQGWRRFVEQTGSPANVADKAEVDRLLVAHGQRTSAPVELFKLEEQRVASEFRPRLEAAMIRVAAAQKAWNEFQTRVSREFADKLVAAQAAASVAEKQHREAATELYRYETRIGNPGSWALPAMAAGLFALGIGGIGLAFTRTSGKGAYVLGSLMALGLCGVAVWAVSETRGTEVALAARNAQEQERKQLLMARNAEMAPAGRDFLAGDAAVRDGAKLEMPEDAAWGGDNEPGAKPGQGKRPGFPAPPRGGMGNLGGFGGLPAQPGMPGGPGVGGGIMGFGGGGFAGGPPAGPGMVPGGGFGFAGQPVPGMGGPMAGGQGKGEQILDRKQLADVLRRRPVAIGGGGRGIPAADIAPIDAIPVGGDGRPLPFIVREYAHQRDASLGDVRADFTETVYWHPVLVLPETGKTTIEFQLSDDIARYQVLVAGHTTDGRIGAVTTTIEARKPFSVDPKLPLEISHTDKVDVPIRVTNDSEEPRNVTFTVTPAGLQSAAQLRDSFDLRPNGKARKILRLVPNQLQGDAGLAVVGASQGADNDTIFRTFKVVPDGFPGVGSFSDMMEKRATGSITLPRDVVPGSLKVRLEVYPTSMADLVKGLEGLLQEPGGCFEQTSTSNYPNTMIIDYMNQTNQTNPEVAKQARGMLERGYARLIAFECPDTPTQSKQGFEWFGGADQQHEALTAYGLMQFKDMARVTPVDPELIKRTQAFLLSRKDGRGGFKRNARALDSFGGAPKHTTDAYIVWALVESDPADVEKMDLRKEIDALKAEAMKEDSVGGKDSYFVALVANVLLHRGDREAAHRLLDRLQEKHTQGGKVTGAMTSITRSGGRDLEIETTALALLGWLRANDPKYATIIKEATRWISQQRGGYGGFGSTQSTILALKALILHAKKSAHPAESGEIQVKVGGNVIATRRFTEKDVEVIGVDIEKPETIFKLGEKTEVEIVTDAKQAYPFALSYTYTTLTPVSAEQCAVRVGTKLAKAEANEGDTVPLTVTFENVQKQGQGMAVAIVGLPAGLKVPTDMKQLTDLREKGVISFFETRGRELVLYWRELAPEQKIELSVDLVCDVPGEYRGPASRGYLYYNADHKHWVEPLSIRIAPMNDDPAGK